MSILNDSDDFAVKKLNNLPLPHKAEQTSHLHFGLIVPPSPFIVPRGWEWVHLAPFEGPSIIATIVKGLGYKFTLLDQRDQADVENLNGKLSSFDFVGIATYEDSFPYIKRVCEIAKKEDKNRPVILGSSLVTSAPEVVMTNTFADYAVIGEGELTLIELLDYLDQDLQKKSIDQIAGLAWKNQDGVVNINKPRAQIVDLDMIPFLDLTVWSRFENMAIPEIYMSTSRGCSNACTFCFRTMPKLNFKSIRRIRQEINYLTRYKFSHVWWNDLCFISDRNRTVQLMDQAFGEYSFSWNCFSRVTDVDLEVLQKMKDRGCDIILYGFEAISQQTLDFYRKKISPNDMIGAIELTKQAGIKVGGLFIIGAPEDDSISLQKMMEFATRFKDITRVKYLSAIPGTPFYKKALREGLIKDELSHLYFLGREESVEEDIDKEGFVMFSPHLTKNDLRRAYQVINSIVDERPYKYKD